MVSWSIAGRRSALALLAGKLGDAGRRLYRGRRVLLAVLRLLARFVLVLAGMACGVVAAWGVAWQFGLFVAMISCFVLEWIIKDSGADDRRRP